jgi:hypothetical protein
MTWVFIEDREYGSSFEFDPFSFRKERGRWMMEHSQWNLLASLPSFANFLTQGD